ncbi:MAG: hypothetical protein AAF499_02160, partial [Pseudomonadota bacterium]
SAGHPLMVIINGDSKGIDWQLPSLHGRWLCVLHTDSDHWREPASARVENGHATIPAHSIAVYRLH